jgi:hypothetical protein
VGDKRGQIADLVSISKRPATVEERADVGLRKANDPHITAAAAKTITINTPGWV